jgi:hypothetical protein
MLRNAVAVSGSNVLHAGDGIGIGEVQGCCVVIWRDAVVPHRFELQRRYLDEIIGRHGSGSSFMCVIEPSSTPPNDALRRASAEMVLGAQKYLRTIVCVIEGSVRPCQMEQAGCPIAAQLTSKRSFLLSKTYAVRCSLAPRGCLVVSEGGAGAHRARPFCHQRAAH